MNRRHLLAALVAAPLALQAAGAQAHNHDRDRELAEQLQALGEVLPLQQVLADIQERYPGHVLEVEFEDDDDHCRHESSCEKRWVYEFKIMQSDGTLIKLKVDARTGEVIKETRRSRSGKGHR